MEVGHVDATPDDAARLLRVAEVDHPGFAQRIDRDDLRAAPFGDLQGLQHARVVGAGVLAGDDDALGVVDVAQADAALADADRLREGDAGGLVAHVGAVGQVVGAERADEQLVRERGLVGRPPGRVEHGFVRTAERPELAGDQLERFGPLDRLVVGAAGPLDHRVGDATLLPEPHLVVGVELVDAVGREELRRGTLACRFFGDGLGAVLAELGGVAVLGIGIGPGAAHAVEAVGLVQLEQGAGRARHAHVGHRTLQGDADAGDAGGGGLRVVDVGHRNPLAGDVTPRAGARSGGVRWRDRRPASPARAAPDAALATRGPTARPRGRSRTG